MARREGGKGKAPGVIAMMMTKRIYLEQHALAIGY